MKVTQEDMSMTLKKMLLLASMALAAIAFAAPAAAQAEAYWTTTDGTVGDESEAVPVDLEAEITSTIGTLNTKATIFLTGEVWNDEESKMGEGEITLKEATGKGTVAGVPAFLDCTVEVTLLGGNWPLTLTTDTDAGASTTDATVDVEEVKFVNHYNAGCQAAGVPPTGGATGTVTATASTDEDHVDLTLEGGDLTVFNPATGEHVPGPIPATISSNPSPIELTADPSGSIGVEQHDE
jgi:hypothetical protein